MEKLVMIVLSGRWLYFDQWGYGGQSQLGTSGEGGELSPYTWYKETAVGNPVYNGKQHRNLMWVLILDSLKDLSRDR